MNTLGQLYESAGVSILETPPNVVERVYRYAELSDFLDVLCWDIVRFRPNILDTTAAGSIKVGILKTILYTVALDHFRKSGIASGSSYSIPDTANYPTPRPLLAWLQSFGPYSEGLITGKLLYPLPATEPVVGNDSLIGLSVPLETSIAASAMPVSLYNYLISNTLGEVYLSGGVSSSLTINANWNANSESVANALRSSGYPLLPMWDAPPPVTNGSLYAFPTLNQIDSTGLETEDVYLSCAFNQWDVELASLYYSAPNTADQYGLPFDSRPGLMAASFPITGYRLAGYLNPYLGLKAAFCFILRNCPDYFPGCPLKTMRCYHGDRLRTFITQTLAINLNGWHELTARTLDAIAQLGWVPNNTAILQYNALMDACFVRKWSLSAISYLHGDLSSAQPGFVTAEADSVNLPTPLVPALNDFGPIVRGGKLCIPGAPFGSAIPYAWFTLKDSLGVSASVGQSESWGDPNMYATNYSGLATTTDTWNYRTTQIVLNSAWVVAYSALAGILCPWVSLGRKSTIVTNIFVGSLTAQPSYGRGDYIYPISRSPRGGLAMTSYTLPNQDPNSDLSSLGTLVNIGYYPVTTIGGFCPLTGPDIALATICRFNCLGTIDFKVLRYLFVLDYKGENSLITTWVSKILSPGGIFSQELGKYLMKRHSGADLQFGIAGAHDTADDCVWDAVKSIAGAMSEALIPAASVGASLACGLIPGVGPAVAPLCGAGTAILGAYIKDTSQLSTNRHAAVPFAVERQRISKTLKTVLKSNKLSQQPPPNRVAVVPRRVAARGRPRIVRPMAGKPFALRPYVRKPLPKVKSKRNKRRSMPARPT